MELSNIDVKALIQKVVGHWSDEERLKFLVGCIMTDKRISLVYFNRLMGQRIFREFLRNFDSNLYLAIKRLLENHDPLFIIKDVLKIDSVDFYEIEEVLTNNPEYYIDILANIFIQYVSILNMYSSSLDIDKKFQTNLIRLALSYSRLNLEKTAKVACDIKSVSEVLSESGRVIYETKFSYLNELFGGGLRSKRLYTIGGVAGIGKSHFLLNMFIDACLNKVKTVYITLENSLEETQLRIYSNIFNIDIYELLKYYEKDFLKEEGSKKLKISLEEYLAKSDKIVYNLVKKHQVELKLLSDYGILKEMTICTVDDLKRMVKEEEPEVLIVDYLNIIEHSPYQSRVENLEDLTMSLHRIATEFDIAVVTACQQNREALRMHTPDGATVGESFGIVKASDVYFILYHPRELRKDDNDSDAEEIILKISKSRISKKARLLLKVNKARSQFREMTSEEIEEFLEKLKEKS